MQVETNNNNEEMDPGLSEVFERLVEKPVKPVVSRSEINYVNREHKAIVRSIADTTGRIINLGKKLARMRDRFEYGEWIPFVERELEFSVRTVQRYIRAADLSADLVLGTDPAEFLAKVWGHKPKEEATNNTTRASYCDDKTTGSGGTASEGSEDDDHDGEGEPFDNSTEGGEAFTTGKFPAKERKNVAFYRDVIKLTDAFLNQPIAESEKLTSLQELYSYFRSRLEKQAERMGVRPEDVL